MDENLHISTPIEADEEGMIGRECPQQDCEKYFKVKCTPNILKKPNMFCPYCTHKGTPKEFFTKEQIQYMHSIALRHISNMIGDKLKKLERHSFNNSFLSLSIKANFTPIPIKTYIEKRLQENLKCENCGLEYSIYGVFAVCPDCGKHNAFQIYSKNAALIRKQVELEDTLYQSFDATNHNAIHDLMDGVGKKLIEDACNNLVTVFEAYCKEVYHQATNKATDPEMVIKGNAFQSLDRTKEIIMSQFNIDIFAGLSKDELEKLYLLFNKRHLLTHNLGIIDEKFLANTGLRNNILNHKVEISKIEILQALTSSQKIAEQLKNSLLC